MEDQTRKASPVPACIMERDAPPDGAAARALREEEYWKAVFPQFVLRTRELPTGSVACTGTAAIRDLIAEGRLMVQPGMITIGGGPDRLKIVWLRTVEMADGNALGALALLRSNPDAVEVYAVGTYRGKVSTRFSMERLGPELVIVAMDEGCAANKGSACDSIISVHAPRAGDLPQVAKFALERIAFASGSEAGVPGMLRFHMTAVPAYVDGGIKLLEQVKVEDSVGHEVRKAEIERAFTFRSGEAMTPTDDPIWPRVYPEARIEKKK